jgi:hypothetical protein
MLRWVMPRCESRSLSVSSLADQQLGNKFCKVGSDDSMRMSEQTQAAGDIASTAPDGLAPHAECRKPGGDQGQLISLCGKNPG